MLAADSSGKRWGDVGSHNMILGRTVVPAECRVGAGRYRIKLLGGRNHRLVEDLGNTGDGVPIAINLRRWDRRLID